MIVSHDLNLGQPILRPNHDVEGRKRLSVGTPSEVMSVEILREVYGCDVLVDRHPESGAPADHAARVSFSRSSSERVDCCGRGSCPAHPCKEKGT